MMEPPLLPTQAVQRRTNVIGRLKSFSARQVAPGGEKGWWRWLVPGLVVVVILFAAVDVRRSSERAGSALDAASAAEDFSGAAERASVLHGSLPRTPSRSTEAFSELAVAVEQLPASLSTLKGARPNDVDLDELATRTSRAQRAADSLLAAGGGPGIRRGARDELGRALSTLVVLTGSVSDRYTAEAREAKADARQRLIWTVLAAGVLLALLLGIFWSKRSAVEAERRERRFRALLKNSSDLVLVIEPGDLTVRYATPVVKRMLGADTENVVGSSLLDLAHPADRDTLAASLESAVSEKGDAAPCPWRARHVNGGFIDVEAVCLDLADDPSVRGTVVTVRDVGERKTLEERLRHQAFHDPLTGLPNRALFEDRVRHAVARVRRHGHGLAVLFVDLDDFKTVNDSLGHGAGDELLRKVAGRLDQCTRSEDTVARLGGDEFAVLVETPQGITQAEDVASRLHATLDDTPFEVAGHELFMHSSVGIALADNGASSEDLLRNADMAMYAAKASGKGRTEVFRATMHMAARKRLQLSGDLRRALRDGDLTVQYQPLVRLEDGQVLGAEALARWNHSEIGDVSPEDFIPIAEETGLIVDLGRWVLGEACRQAKEWQDTGAANPPIYVSVNVSARQFRQPGTVVRQVREATSESGVNPSLLVLEITESVLMQDREAVGRELSELQGLGVRVAIDDFGTGYSALSYLREFPIDMVKMDRSFVNDLASGAGDAALVKSVVELGGALDMQIVAEGIERRDQLESLSGLNCDVGQGYFFARPLGPAAITEMLIGKAFPPAPDAPRH